MINARQFSCGWKIVASTIDRVDNCHALINQNSTKHRRCHPFFLGSSAPRHWLVLVRISFGVSVYLRQCDISWRIMGVFSARRHGFGGHSDVAVAWSCPRRSRAAPARPCRDRGLSSRAWFAMFCCSAGLTRLRIRSKIVRRGTNTVLQSASRAWP